MFSGVHEFIQVCSGVHEFTQVFSGVHEFTQMFSGVHEFTHVFSGVHEFTQVFSGVFCVVVCRSLFVPFGHCTFKLSLLLRITTSDYSFAIFKHFFYATYETPKLLYNIK